MTDDSVIDPIVNAIQSDNMLIAEQLCRMHLESESDDEEVLLLLGFCLQKQGREAEAVEPYMRLTRLCPNDSMHWGNYATALDRAGDLEAAEFAASRTVELAPDDPERLEQLGMLRMQLGKLLDARDVLLRASAKAPESANIRIHAARACVACHDTRTADLLHPWREWTALDDGQQIELADLLIQIGEVRDATELLEELVRHDPTNWMAQLWLAKVYERVNRLDESQSVLQYIVTNGGTEELGFSRSIARQNAQLAIRRHAYGAARTLLEQIGPGDDKEYGHYFALACACDKQGSADAAMGALEIAHARQVDEIRSFAGHLLEPGAPVLLHATERLHEDDYRAWPKLHAPDANQSPVFVVGFPRSGTTLLEQMLDAHQSLQSMDERPFFNNLADQLADVGIRVPDDLYKLNQRDCDELRKGYVVLACGKVPRHWNARLVDKNPLNMLWLPMIHRMFPAGKVILALRHPCDVILSCYLQNFRAAPLAVACKSLETLAHAYLATMNNWLYHVQLLQPDVFVSRYENLVADPVTQVRRIADFLELGDAESMLRFDERAREKGFIATPSYTQVVEPISSRGVGHWQQYRAYFEPLLPVLQPMLEYWGYAEPSANAVMLMSH